MEAGGSECREHILEQLPRSVSLRVRQAMDLVQSIFLPETLKPLSDIYRPDFQRTCAICELGDRGSTDPSLIPGS